MFRFARHIVVARNAAVLRRRHGHGACLTATIMSFATAAEAGPPYVTDDPDPTPHGTVEAYLFSDGALTEGRFKEASTGFEINVGALPNLQLSGAVALEYGSNSPLHVGAAELGAKYRFVEEHESGWQPQISFYPQMEISLDRKAGEGNRYLLPLWAQKSIDDWTLFGGGGYRISPGVGQLNSWLGGLAVERKIGERLSVGSEIYGETRDATGEPGHFGIGLGVTWELNERFELLGSAGPLFEGRRVALAYYFALGWHGK